jgi:hypothetical protein
MLLNVTTLNYNVSLKMMVKERDSNTVIAGKGGVLVDHVTSKVPHLLLAKCPQSLSEESSCNNKKGAKISLCKRKD